MHQIGVSPSAKKRQSDTPTFGIGHELHESSSGSRLQRKDSKQTEVEENTRNCIEFRPETILQQSSNSSDGDVLAKKYQFYHPSESSDTQPVFQITMKETDTDRNWRGDKSRGDKFKSAQHVISLTNNFMSKKSFQKESDKVTSSLGLPTFPDSARKRTILSEVEAEEDCKIFKQGSWTRTKLMLTEYRLSFFEFSCDIADLTKIKILPSNASKIRAENIIKIQVIREVNLFSLSLDKKFYGLPTAFYIFAKLIDKKMSLDGRLKVEDWQKSEHIEKLATQDSYIYGNIYKKSQHLGNWQSRFVVIKKNGIYSYRDSKLEQTYSFYINSQSVKYLWTRFDMIDDYLIIKIKHGLSKTEFGIPLSQFSTRTMKNWLYCFYRTLQVPNISLTK